MTTTAGDFTTDTENKLILFDGKPLELTRKEYELLSLFIRNEGKIFSRSEILSRVWSDDVIVTDRSVDVTIARIRRKIGKRGNMIKNKSGYGYYFGE
jgi:DNA-binding response OmpR family regulator